MKSFKTYSVALLLVGVLFSGCERMEGALDTETVQEYKLTIQLNSKIVGIDLDGLDIVLENFAEGFKLEKKLTGNVNHIEGLIPGIYSINISGRAENDGKTYLLKGNKVNYAVVKNNGSVTIDIDGMVASPLIFSEIFYAGTVPFYFRNQFYEVYNNSLETIYLDGLHFANLTPGNATTVLPLWPAEDAGRYVYAERVWKIPGNGTEYPLKPGESFVMAQFAANHKLPQYNAASPIDASSAEFEFNMNNPNFPDQQAVDMAHVFYNNSASKGTLPQYLTAVFGGAYVIFKVPAGETYDPVNNAQLKTRNLAGTATQIYAKVPMTYILDAVEAGDNQNKITGKRVPAVLDAGMTYVGATYNSLGVARKLGDTNTDGTPFLVDSNNSTEDFERGVVPMFRRHGAKMPTWNHTLK